MCGEVVGGGSIREVVLRGAGQTMCDLVERSV